MIDMSDIRSQMTHVIRNAPMAHLLTSDTTIIICADDDSNGLVLNVVTAD